MSKKQKFEFSKTSIGMVIPKVLLEDREVDFVCRDFKGHNGNMYKDYYVRLKSNQFVFKDDKKERNIKDDILIPVLHNNVKLFFNILYQNSLCLSEKHLSSLRKIDKEQGDLISELKNRNKNRVEKCLDKIKDLEYQLIYSEECKKSLEKKLEESVVEKQNSIIKKIINKMFKKKDGENVKK